MPESLFQNLAGKLRGQKSSAGWKPAHSLTPARLRQGEQASAAVGMLRVLLTAEAFYFEQRKLCLLTGGKTAAQFTQHRRYASEPGSTVSHLGNANLMISITVRHSIFGLRITQKQTTLLKCSAATRKYTAHMLYDDFPA